MVTVPSSSSNHSGFQRQPSRYQSSVHDKTFRPDAFCSLDGSPDLDFSSHLAPRYESDVLHFLNLLLASKMRLLLGELSFAATLALVAVAAGQESRIDDLDFSMYKTDLLPHPFHPSAKQSPAPWYLENFGNGDKDCPPCFNCMLPAFECKHFANCSEYDGKCKVSRGRSSEGSQTWLNADSITAQFPLHGFH
jgi:hypothetical protein